MTQEISGSINEVRRVFTAATGEIGKVDFGRSYHSRQGFTTITCVKIDMQDGRKAWGKYGDPKTVTLTLRAGYERKRVAVVRS